MKKFQKRLACVLVAVCMVFSWPLTTIASATEAQARQEEAQKNSAVGGVVSPNASSVELFNKGGVVTDGTWSSSFVSGYYFEAGEIIANLRYIDGHIGYVYVSVNTTMYRVLADGKSRVLDRDLFLPIGTNSVVITGADGPLAFSIVISGSGAV